MHTLVVLEVYGLAEALATGITAIRPLPCVDAHVQAEASCVGQLLSTDAAAVGLLLRVHALVDGE